MKLAVRYALFAALSMVANLAVQALVLVLLRTDAVGLPVAMAAGTSAAFALKYWLDKRWIFDSRSEHVGQEVRKVFVYGVFSVGTTLVFWATEASFTIIWRTAWATYLGGAIGLCGGYVIKYYLDKHYTFGKPA